MKYLEVMQKHLDIARERITELEMNSDDHLKRTKKVYRSMVIGLFALTVYLGYNNMRFGADNRELVKQLEASSNLQERFDNVVEDWQYQSNRARELQDANEKLIEHCRPCDVTKAIKATPLPKLLRGV